jgi:hypothetical protein
MNFEVHNRNYACVVVEIGEVSPVEGLDNLRRTYIFGNSILVGKDVSPGDLGLYFPLESALSQEFLASNNLFRKAELNRDPKQKGFFEEHGRVRAVKFRGVPSEGFFCGIQALAGLGFNPADFKVGDEFEAINGKQICKKYVRKGARTRSQSGQKGEHVSKVRVEDKILDGQLRLHYDTGQLRRNAHQIEPGTLLSISDKWHGTSIVIGNLLCKRELNWFERLLLRWGVPIRTTEYQLVVTSRKVVKFAGAPKEGARHFYS